ncbi:MAG: ABC transporter ATP-binding protein [Candidatus Accumulibacter sp.]|nr:ABC transporter ATP-binding protein [Accumulibacter sp.]
MATGLGARRAADPVDYRFLGDGLSATATISQAPASGASPILRFDDLTLGYDRHPAVHHLHGEIAAGSLLAIVGPNGAGKSTLLKGISGELRPLQGRVERLGVQRRQIAYLSQQTTLDSSFPMVVHDFVAMGLWRAIGAFRGLDHGLRQRIAEAIDLVGLCGLESRPIGALSGGQLQRAHFARVVLQDAPLVLLDEPYGAIDAASVRDLAALVRRWHGEGRTVIAVLHDLEHVRQEYPETLLLAREIVARGATAAVLSDDHLARARQIAEGRGDEGQAAVCHAERASR